MADCDSTPVRIIAYIMPRTISSALSKCLSGVDGMEIWFERFTRAGFVRQEYELQTGDDMPMESEGNVEKVQEAAKLFRRLAQLETELVPDKLVYGNVKKELQASTSKHIFAKEAYFAFPDAKSRQYIPGGFKHVFLIRDPCRLFMSYRKAIYLHLTNVGIRTGDALDEEAFDIGRDDPIMNANEFYKGIVELWKYVRDNVDPDPIVINTDDLLANPAEMLSKFCHLTGLPYSDSLLQWDASPDVTKTWETGVDDIIELSIAFFETAVYSSGFLPQKPAVPLEKLAPDVRRLAEASMPYFEEINKYSMTLFGI